MHFYSIQKSFAFIKRKIRGTVLVFSSKHIAFLDEFTIEPWAIFLRNLAIAIGLSCVVVNTNTRVVNVFGRYSISGGEAHSIWSVIVYSLNSATVNLLSDLYDLEQSIQVIKLNRLFSDYSDSMLYF